MYLVSFAALRFFFLDTHPKMKIRVATKDDISGAARVVLAALVDEASWKTFVAGKSAEYVEDVLRKYLGSHDCQFLVADGTGATIAALAIWDLSGTYTLDKSASDYRSDRVTNTVAVPALAPLEQAREKHFAGPFVLLQLLATRPNLRGKGYGKALVAAGIDAARARQASVGAFTASRGYILLSGLGFVDVGAVGLPVDEVAVKAMVLDAKQVQRRRSWWDSLVSYVTT